MPSTRDPPPRRRPPVKDNPGEEHKLPSPIVLYSCRHAAITQMLMDGMAPPRSTSRGSPALACK